MICVCPAECTGVSTGGRTGSAAKGGHGNGYERMPVQPMTIVDWENEY